MKEMDIYNENNLFSFLDYIPDIFESLIFFAGSLLLSAIVEL
jgi:hypothetical protein